VFVIVVVVDVVVVFCFLTKYNCVPVSFYTTASNKLYEISSIGSGTDEAQILQFAVCNPRLFANMPQIILSTSEVNVFLDV
jgi:hypothetical protein